MLTLDTLLAIALFALVTSITPGPNNLMLLASGVNHGIRATVPHLMGVNLGFLVLLLSVGLGLGAVFERYPAVYALMKWLGVAYLLYLAWGMARSGPPGEAGGASAGPRPMGFWAAASFQWVNPKAWVMAVGVFSSYLAPGHSAAAVVAVAALFALINAPSIGLWALFGARMREHLRNPRVLRAFNWGMAALLLASLVPMLQANP
jgi:threonine/homoserine/homoserine lactone efflux protein